MQNKLLLVDSNSIIHRAYHGLPFLKSESGHPTGAIFGFFNILFKLIEDEKPSHIACAFDLRAPTFRHKMFDQYKGTRKPMDEELRVQFEPIKEILSAMNIAIVSKEGFEADDILGTLSHKYDINSIVVTGDKDSLQLVDEKTRIYLTKTGVTEVIVYDTDRLLEDGFTTKSFIDYKALRGDTSDNIPGISGVGEKTAKKLLDEFGTLENILDNASQIKGKIGEKIGASREIAFLSRELSIIDRFVPLDITLEDLLYTGQNNANLVALLKEYELFKLIKRLNIENSETAEDESVDFEKTVVELDQIEDIKTAISGNLIALNIDENISFAVSQDKEFLVKCTYDLFGGGVCFDDVIDILRDKISDKELVCYDAKSMMKKYDFAPKSCFDIMLSSHLVKGSQNIKNIDVAFLGSGLDVGTAEMLALAEIHKDKLIKMGLDRLFYDIEMPLVGVLVKMENSGIAVSNQKLQVLREKYEAILADLTAKIYDCAGCTFNVASPKQLGEVLFDKLGLKQGKKTKTGYSVSEDVLKKLHNEHPIVDLVLEFRHYSKLLSTYVVGLQNLINRGRIHTDFNQAITTTGRLSSTNPNLQNIPVRGEDAKDIKSAFEASAGNKLISADYSQIELRLLAHFSEDESLVKTYNENGDIHALTASQVLGIDIKNVTQSQRRDAKAINFGIVYGMSDFGLSENLNIPVYQARDFISRYFDAYKKIKIYLDGNISYARENGYIQTLMGRKRNLTDITASNYLLRSASERMAMNTPLQGSASDIMKIAMLRVDARLDGMKSKLILQIHDELIVDTDASETGEVKQILKEEMESAVMLRVPLVVDINESENWGDLK